MPTFVPASVGLLRARALARLRSGRARVSGSIAEPGGFGVAWVFGFVALHMALALLMKQVRPLAGVHAVVTLVMGLRLCSIKSPPLHIAQWAAYVAGVEVLWRMCKAPIPWEFAKHSIWLVCLISLLRSPGLRRSWLPAVYFALLLPAVASAFLALPFHEARSEVSFALSGPLCLALCAFWFSSLRLTASGFQRVGVMALAPIAGAGAVVFFGMTTAEVGFTTASNSSSSGGYGPNQVSSMLSLGALLAVFLLLGEKRSFWLKAGFVVLSLWLLAQSALTFSRTGIYLFVAAFGLATIFLVQAKGSRFLLLLLVLGAATFISLPLLDAFTGGKLAERFSDKGLTGRDNIASLDLEVWRNHPMFGAGAGMSMYERAVLGDDHAAHTEFTRMVADHGLLGAGALMILLLMTGQAFLQARGPWAKAVVSALTVWAFGFMMGTGMRLAAPAFLLGLIHARFLAENPVRLRSAKPARRVPFPGNPWAKPTPLTSDL